MGLGRRKKRLAGELALKKSRRSESFLGGEWGLELVVQGGFYGVGMGGARFGLGAFVVDGDGGGRFLVGGA